eukprot:CAMPEP_0175833042 /NCGR_PEP_ID=MMETSP0107_2-20121207/15305_1 /TAXON_ID=195067 ORGANISM="Goniomonas pacifica, Strain CCMP1869" /NCGR_SAMPLE_ID=MMETSP0107_2 /ASSEMBLY_ACC=CAM_ASM_000203 /LENGTH=61 /DNA_ID=CAMNT_0017146157 /DNA_START=901 /DNA_END=1083 /DNA_ORIENTATION=-
MAGAIDDDEFRDQKAILLPKLHAPTALLDTNAAPSSADKDPEPAAAPVTDRGTKRPLIQAS